MADAATSNFWAEFEGKVADRLKAVADDTDPKLAHERFLKNTNFALEFAIMKVWRAYSEENDDGTRKIDKEASMKFFDSLIVGCEKEALQAIQEYTKYVLKFNAASDEGTAAKKTEFLDKAEKDALKEAKAKALSDMLPGAKQDSIAKLEKAIEAAKAAEADVEEATKTLDELKKAKEDADSKAAAKKEEAEKKDAAAKEKKLEKMSDEEKEKFEKTEAAKKEKEEKAAADAASKKEAAEKKLAEALEAAGDDVDAVGKAVADAKRDSGKPDVTAAEAKLDELEAAKADAATKEAARTGAVDKWSSELGAAIDTLIKDQSADYKANVLTKQKAAFDKFFGGKNQAGEDDYELPRDDLKKVLTVGAGDFEGFIQELGFKVSDADALEALKGALAKDDEKTEEKKD